MNGLEKCVWLNGVEGLSADLLRDISDELSEYELLELLLNDKKITPRSAEKLNKLLEIGWTQREIDKACASGLSLIHWYSEDYPVRLRDIAEPPLVLYVKGRLPDFERSCAIVGTRRCTLYGAKVAELLGGGLARVNYTVVSGGANGIDGAAHFGCTQAAGRTAAVLGTGVDVIWPPNHAELFDTIVQEGALISEFPLGTKGLPRHFPRRNRIIAGLTQKLVVVESPVKGGSMITARLAMEMGREIWAVPGRIDENVCAGSNQLIFDGASPLVNISDFVDHVSGLGQLELFTPVTLSGDEQKVLDCLGSQGGLTLDQISARTGLSAVVLMQITSDLSVQSLIYPTGGGRWRSVPR